MVFLLSFDIQKLTILTIHVGKFTIPMDPIYGNEFFFPSWSLSFVFLHTFQKHKKIPT